LKGASAEEAEGTMDDLEKERTEGVDWGYLAAATKEREEVGGAYFISLANHMGHFFAIMAKAVIDRLGKEEGSALLKAVVEDFGMRRGRRIAEKVRALGKPLALKNFVLYGDMDSAGVTSGMTPSIEDGDFLLEIKHCEFDQGAKDAGLGEYAYHYCKYIDTVILKGYNPDLKLEVLKNLSAGDDACLFRYRLKDTG
jgi:predicted hydrocarbon binding protein